MVAAGPAAGVRAHATAGDDDDASGFDGEAATPGRPLRVERLLANLGYGKRQECAALVSKGRARHVDGRRLKVGEKVSQWLAPDEERSSVLIKQQV
jgi:hypothetical protein